MPVLLDDYRVKQNNFSGKHLQIIYLSYYDSTFSINNTLLPLQELGTVHRFEMTQVPHEKDWYEKKPDCNARMLEFVEKTVSEYPIDIIVCYLAGHSTTEEVLKKIRSYGIPMINESLDDERKFRNKIGKDGTRKGLKNVCKYFDISLTTSKSAIVKYLVEGGKPLYKDYAGNEKVYRNLHLEKIYDVAFVGADYGIRREYIEFLRRNGISVYTKGSGWEEGFAESDEMIEIFNKAKIVLGFSTVGKNDDIFILKGRDFEVPLTGSFYLTGDHEELTEYFKIGTDIATYTTKEDLLDKVRYFLAHEDEREVIAKHGYVTCLNHYTAKKSYEKVFGYLGL
jgi:spore maturation protein CgeB